MLPLRLRPSFALLTVSLAVAAPAARADTIRVQSTTDTIDAGLVDVLRPAYKAAQPGDDLAYVGVGTGKALDNARAGLADVVITHAPSLESRFVQDGFSLEPFGRAIFFSDYVIVGPADDPAGVSSRTPHDAVSAFEAIAAAGAAGRATFVSRGDNSGTNVQEETMWGLTNGVPTVASPNASGAPGRVEPTGSWYAKTQKGQAANVQETDVCNPATYPNGGCYTMVDRGTFNRLLNAGSITRLKVASDRNLATARGGENLLVNPFSAYIVNPDRIATDPRPNVAAAQRFLDFLTSPAFQAAVDSFPTASDPAFHADAFPAITLGTPLPQVVTAGQAVALDLTATNRLPGGGQIGGLPVQLQISVDDGASWTDTGQPVSTDAAGRASLRPVITATSRLRVVVPRVRQFSPSTTDLGLVAATPAPAPVAAKDTTRPSVTRPVLTRRRLTLTLSEGATVTVTIARKVRTVTRKGGRRTVRTVLRTAKRLALRATKAGTVTRTFRPIRAGRYRLRIVATDLAGNRATRTTSLTVRATTKAGRR